MKTVIMAGGFGTRLRPLTCNLPKPMVSIANKPMMEHIINILKKNNLKDIVALLFFQGEEIKNYFGDGSKFGVKIEYVTSTEDYGTAGSVKNAEGELYGGSVSGEKERVLVISGDVLTDIDLSKAIDFHVQNKASATLVLSRLENPLSYGVVITREDGRISRFLEKPTWGEVFSDTVNTGIYILEPEVLEKIPFKREFDFSKDLFPLMLKENEKLYGFISPDYWRDVGNLDEYSKAHQDILEGKVKIEIEGNLLKRKEAMIWVGKNVQVGQEVEFEGVAILGSNSDIGSRSKISNSVVGEGVHCGEGVNMNRSVVWKDSFIGNQATLMEAVVSFKTIIGEEATLLENSIVSDNCIIGSRAKISANVKIWPGKEVESGAILSTSLVWGEKWNRELFTDAKVSGLGNLELTPEFAVKLGAAFGAILGKGTTVVTSRDAGKTSRMTNRAVICGLLSSGVNVKDLRTLPIPVVRYELKSGREQGGIHVRSSPLDDKIIDIIFFDGNGQDLPTSKAKAVERFFFREDFRRASMEDVGQLDFPQRVIEYYRNDFLKGIDTEAIKKSEFKVVIDYSYGGASEIFPSILGALECDIISLNAYLDPKRLVRKEEEEIQALHRLSTIVKSLKADVGFLLDPGAEKISTVDEKGEFISADLLLLIVTSLFLSSNKAQKIAVPVVASIGVEKIASEYGVKVIRVRNDHLAMMDALSSLKVDFVGGTKGGFIFPGFQLGADAMFNVVKLLELMARANRKFGNLREELDRFYRITEEIPCDWSKKGQVMRELILYTEKFKRELIDGVRVLYDDSWILVVPDNRKANLHIYVEAMDKAIAEKLFKEYVKKIEEWQK